MNAGRRKLLLSSLKLFDVTLMICSFLLASRAVMSTGTVLGFEQFLSMRVKLANVMLFAGLICCWHLVFSVRGLYDSRRTLGRKDDVVDVAKAAIWGSLLVLVAASTLRVRLVTTQFVLVFSATALCLSVVSRLALRTLLERIRLRGRNLRHILIVGTNPRAIDFANRVASRPEYGYHLVGFVDDTWNGLETLSRAGYTRICDFTGLANLLGSTVVDEVVIAVPIASFHNRAARIAAICEEQGITVRVVSNIFNLKLARSQTEDLDGAPTVAHYTGIGDGWPLVIKRVIDIIFATLVLVVCAPLLLLVTVLIKLTSPGPVLFRQTRVGLNKRRFTIYKFRTMVPGAEQQIKQLEHKNEVSGPVFKIRHDPRITPIGHLLRKASIDELPQLVNVLKGDMSLVGPRPLPVRDYEGFNKDWQRRRFSVRPGITCLWQVNGRSSIPFEKWMQLDLQYIDRWSLWLDLRILLRTIPAVLRGSGAA